MITKIKRKFNSLIHKEPYESLAYGVFWFLFLLVVVPLISLLVVIPLTIYRLVDWLLDSTLEVNTGYFDPKKYDEEREMAVIVTNCDVSEDSSSSYSKDIVLWAANAGFTVFAFCQSEESMKYYQTKNKETLTSRIIPIKVDITKDDDIQKAVSQISGWMNHFNLNDRNEDDTKEDQTKQRVVHALINNCGTSNTPGYFDWLDVTDCQESMNLNYFGMIRCCKAFVPIFKEQSKMLEGVSGGRIINITNISGLLPGSPFFWNYATTQHACQVFTEGLRKELSSFGIDVTTINPSYTQQQIVSGIETTVSKMWKTKMSVDKKQEYGEERIKSVLRHDATKMTSSFPMKHVGQNMELNQLVVDKVLELLQLRGREQGSSGSRGPDSSNSSSSSYLPAQVVVGSDAKYYWILLRMLPGWFLALEPPPAGNFS